MLNSFYRHKRIRWLLVLYDMAVFAGINICAFVFQSIFVNTSVVFAPISTLVCFICVFAGRLLLGTYNQIWRYGGVQCYIIFLLSDGAASLVAVIINLVSNFPRASAMSLVSLLCLNSMLCLIMRLAYRYIYKTGNYGKLLAIFSAGKVIADEKEETKKTKIAIVGAGKAGVGLAEEIQSNEKSKYEPCCFIEKDKLKIGGEIHNIPVFSEKDAVSQILPKLGVHEVVLALPLADYDTKKAIYDYYNKAGFKVKTYDYPDLQTVNGKRTVREFNVEELLFRKPRKIVTDAANKYFSGKTVLITGGGGSIGSELCRQIAKMTPKKLVILDVYENGAYDIQQELLMKYGKALDVGVVIVSVCNRAGLERAFIKFRPDIVINAAAHKHVPLMEDDCIEAIENNVFGTINTLEMAERYGVERFIMVSTDKAVNPTNVMGATKRLCEMIVLNHQGKMTCSATRFGNVLGSAGSVIPLFKRQIANGGPVTITDKRIIRYFMTIPEAAQLVLQSGAMAKDKELFVLDMGEPIKILDLAESMIRMNGGNIEIVETGLRPGEKLYEELLVKTEELDKTDNELIYIERDKKIDKRELDRKLLGLIEAVETGDNEKAKKALINCVPTYQPPEKVNSAVRTMDAKIETPTLDAPPPATELTPTSTPFEKPASEPTPTPEPPATSAAEPTPTPVEPAAKVKGM